MQLEDILKAKRKMDENAIPVDGREMSLTWRQMYRLIREIQLSEMADSDQRRENERALNAIAVGNYEIAKEISPSMIYGITLVVNSATAEGG
jgi:hypothetical protein